jgi:hypothetical protein
MLAHMANAGHRFHVHQFNLGVIVPEKVIFEPRGKQPERLAWTGTHYFFDNFHRLTLY